MSMDPLGFMMRRKVLEAGNLIDKANGIVESAKEISNEAIERLRAAADAAERAIDEFAACALTINQTVITRWSSRVKELQPCLGFSDADREAQVAMVREIARGCEEDADALRGKSPKAPSGFLGLLDVLDLRRWATPPAAPLVPPDELLFDGYSLQRAQSYLKEAEDYLEQAQAWARMLKRDEQVLRRIECSVSHGKDILSALAGYVTELTLDLVRPSERSDHAAVERCMAQASRAVKAIAGIISAPMVDESGVTDAFVTAVLRGQVILDETR